MTLWNPWTCAILGHPRPSHRRFLRVTTQPWKNLRPLEGGVKGHRNNSMLLIAERTGSGPGHYDCKEMQRVSNCKKCSLCRGHQAHRDTSDTKDLSRVSDCSMFHGCTRGYGWGEWRITFVEYSSYASGRTLNLYLSRYSCMSSHPRLYCQQINFSTPYPTYQSKSVKIKDLCIDTYRYGSICAFKVLTIAICNALLCGKELPCHATACLPSPLDK